MALIHEQTDRPANGIVARLLFEDLAQAFSGIFPDRFQFGVGAIAGSDVLAVLFAKRFDQGVAALLADFAVAVTLAAIESLRIMFIAHVSIWFAPVVPALACRTASAAQLLNHAKPFTRPRTS